MQSFLPVVVFVLGVGAGGWLAWWARSRLAKTQLAGQEAEAAARLEFQQALHAQSLEAMTNQFKALSADVLRESRQEFLSQAELTFSRYQLAAGSELDKRKEAVQAFLKPLEEQLKTYQARLQQSETVQASSLGEVRKQLETLTLHSQSLAYETQQFRMVLKSSQARGKWGEETLRRVVEAAGMSVHCDFHEQTSAEDTRPDLIVRLPGDRVIVVDAKVPDFDVAAVQGSDPMIRPQLLAEHARKLRTTIRQLAARSYPARFPHALDYVVLFLPAESLFSAALEGDPDLIVWAAEQRVMLATPASLIALLRAVSLTWQQYAQTANAEKIAAEALDLYARLEKFMEHVAKIGAALNKASDAYRDAAGSYEKRIRPSGDRLTKLLGKKESLPELKAGGSVTSVVLPEASAGLPESEE
ncbi:MAG: DNA recombination protein RmuC [Kiritimatiellia bacterium]